MCRTLYNWLLLATAHSPTLLTLPPLYQITASRLSGPQDLLLLTVPASWTPFLEAFPGTLLLLLSHLSGP